MPMGVLGVTTTYTATANPSSVKWDESTTLAYSVTITAGYVWWNGTLYCNLTSPSGEKVALGTSAINLGSVVKADWANYSYDPGESGTWNVTFDTVKTTGNGTLVDKYTSFTVERSGEWLNRTVGDWVALVWMIFGVSMLLVVIVLVVNRTSKEGGGKKD